MRLQVSAGAMATVALLLAGCAHSARVAGDAPYPVPAAFDATRLLAPPPMDASARSRDLQAVHLAERTRTPEQAADAEASSSVDVFLFATVLGPGFSAQRLPVTAAFFGRVYRSSLPYLQAAKDCWHRERPFEVDPTLAPLARSFASTRLRSAPVPVQGGSGPPPDSPCTAPAATPVYSPSYPSGHATVGAMMAILLAQMVPEQRAALFARGWDYGEARVISGVHFPSDVEAGRTLGTLLIGLMQQDRRFRGDLEAARRELRAGLDLPRRPGPN
jgi:acid phosphatase (class A)